MVFAYKEPPHAFFVNAGMAAHMHSRPTVKAQREEQKHPVSLPNRDLHITQTPSDVSQSRSLYGKSHTAVSQKSSSAVKFPEAF